MRKKPSLQVGRALYPGVARNGLSRMRRVPVHPTAAMTDLLVPLAFILLAYLIGSVPFAVVVSRVMGLKDPRSYGSGNPGATNVLRSGSKAAAALTLLGDAAKGWLAVWLAQSWGPDIGERSVALVALAAFLGHLYPLFLRFKGGKGVATLFGMVIAIHPGAALCCAGVFVLVLVATHYVSLSSILAGFTFPFSIAFVFHTSIPVVLLYGIAICALILVTHQKNIERLLKGHESKIYLFKKS